ncbi:hypothetical protein chiPu_0002448 [Chiloscyllium punctatum]|uniref:Uncharacterized protein n=1 Tax=Chiloscyllium punctatum TaxID=137246 RepID=A0A401S0Y3_CHIPU|nr:hypothetical protein [Chiloscyllium punctatum]
MIQVLGSLREPPKPQLPSNKSQRRRMRVTGGGGEGAGRGHTWLKYLGLYFGSSKVILQMLSRAEVGFLSMYIC